MTLGIALLVALSALGLGLGLWRLGRRALRLEIGDRGIRAPALGGRWIPWDEIEGAYPPTSADANTLSLRLRVTRHLAGALGRKRKPERALPPQGTLVVPVDLAGSGLSAVDVLQEILARRDAEADGRQIPDLG